MYCNPARYCPIPPAGILSVPARGPRRCRGFVLLVLLAAGGCGAVTEIPPARVSDGLAPGPVPAHYHVPYLLGRGDTLGGVLERAGLPAAEITSLVETVRGHINPRSLPANMEIGVHRRVHDNRLLAVELVLSPDATLHLERFPGGWVDRLRVPPLQREVVYAEGHIDRGGSLYQVIVADQELPFDQAERIRLVYHLAEVYGYQLDFTHDIRPGDTYRVLYERQVRPDGSSRSAQVLVAEFVVQGRAYPAVRFEIPGDRTDYFNLDGASLRLAFRRYPLDFPRITSTFSTNRPHPILGVRRPHHGTDFGAARGTPAYAAADGTVTSARYNGEYGNMVVLSHPGGYETRYAHLHRFAAGIRPGARVTQGQTIGLVGSTGLATAPHLHYEIRLRGAPLDPRRVTLPGAPPVPEAHREAFDQAAATWMAELRAAGAHHHSVIGPAP